MQPTAEIDDIGLSPSFNCYSNYSLTSMAAAKVSDEVIEEQAAGFPKFSDGDEEDFEFSLDFTGDNYLPKELSLSGRILFPIFNRDLVTKDEVDRTVEEVVHEDSSVIISLKKLFVGDGEGALSSSSSEAEELELEERPSGTFCMSWRKADVRSPTLAECKKSSSTGSGLRKWRIKDILCRSNSAGKEMVLFLCPKKVDALKQKRIVNSSEVRKVAGKSKTTSSKSVHELFYVQRKAEQKGDKMKSYLPYRKDLVGFFVNVNGLRNKKSPF
ncbi:hypothetical protein L2E82_19555 [Cichorium intybus]|uniref:Uncharacterized protein n=1 Tax=Cichorium intybus TaxID=13427 RepID=A0ACB9FCX8_CICIN|nr:hypothetical protein L2E82_19555 [Cichorium intybus]